MPNRRLPAATRRPERWAAPANRLCRLQKLRRRHPQQARCVIVLALRYPRCNLTWTQQRRQTPSGRYDPTACRRRRDGTPAQSQKPPPQARPPKQPWPDASRLPWPGIEDASDARAVRYAEKTATTRVRPPPSCFGPGPPEPLPAGRCRSAAPRATWTVQRREKYSLAESRSQATGDTAPAPSAGGPCAAGYLTAGRPLPPAAGEASPEAGRRTGRRSPAGKAAFPAPRASATARWSSSARCPRGGSFPACHPAT